MEHLNWDSMSAVQREVYRWATERFPHRNWKGAIDKLTYNEIPELFLHIEKHGFKDIGTELADCVILLLDLAEMWGVDLQAAIQAKMETNYQRQWLINPVTGLSQHVEAIEIALAIANLNPKWCPGCTPDNCSGCFNEEDGFGRSIVNGNIRTNIITRGEIAIAPEAVRGIALGDSGDGPPPVSGGTHPADDVLGKRDLSDPDGDYFS